MRVHVYARTCTYALCIRASGVKRTVAQKCTFTKSNQSNFTVHVINSIIDRIITMGAYWVVRQLGRAVYMNTRKFSQSEDIAKVEKGKETRSQWNHQNKPYIFAQKDTV